MYKSDRVFFYVCWAEKGNRGNEQVGDALTKIFLWKNIKKFFKQKIVKVCWGSLLLLRMVLGGMIEN